MASDKQTRANRQNASKSTGPRTRDGKSTSSRNALVHGLTAQHIMLDGEDAALFDVMYGRLVEQFTPSLPLEELLVERLAGLMWRLRRAPVFEAALIAWVYHHQTETSGSVGLVVGGAYFSSHGMLETSRSGAHLDPHHVHRRHLTGRMLETIIGKEDYLSRLGRYEMQLMRQLERTLAEIEKLTKARAIPERPILPVQG
jgi:hypothetical protein